MKLSILAAEPVSPFGAAGAEEIEVVEFGAGAELEAADVDPALDAAAGTEPEVAAGGVDVSAFAACAASVETAITARQALTKPWRRGRISVFISRPQGDSYLIFPFKEPF
jgi:hypothetical protein